MKTKLEVIEAVLESEVGCAELERTCNLLKPEPKVKHNWLIKDLIADKSNVLITGLPRSGKTRIALSLACTLLAGENLFNLSKFSVLRKPTGPIIYVDGLDNSWLFEDILRLLGLPPADIYHYGARHFNSMVYGAGGIIDGFDSIIIFDHVDEDKVIDYSKYPNSLVLRTACTHKTNDGLREARGSHGLAAEADTRIHIKSVGTQTLFQYESWSVSGLEGVLLTPSKQVFSVVS